MIRKKDNMKTIQNKRKIIIALCMAIICTIITCIPIFGANNNINSFWDIPNDINEIETLPIYEENEIKKYYIKIQVIEMQTSTSININMTLKTPTEESITQIINIDEVIYIVGQNRTNFYGFYFIPNVYGTYTIHTYYIPIYTRNVQIDSITTNSNTINVKILSSTNTQDQTISEAFNLGYINGYDIGYNEGYNTGFTEGLGMEQYTNLTGYVTQLLTRFVGADTAPYITPIAIVLVILFVYFLFIRFLLSLIKAKGVIKTCDIIMIVASVLILVCMYAPLFNLTIRNENINTYDTTETTVLSRKEYIYDEYGRIISGPAGTITYEIPEEIYKIEKDVDLTTATREQNDYNRE